MRLRSLLVAIAAITTLLAAAAPGKTPCEASPKIVGKCFRVHGRLNIWQGNPTFRIWRVGTHRIFGVNTAGNDDDESADVLPAEVRSAMPIGPDAELNNVYGDYLVCPFSRSRPGWMQYVCIAKASHVVAKPR